MKKIQLTRGYEAIVDDDDYDQLSLFKWHVRIAPNTNIVYAIRFGHGDLRRTMLLMHRVIMNAKQNEQVDHKNCNGLDNQKINLRICSQGDNLGNSRSFRGPDLKGIYPKVCKKTGLRWIAICAGKYLGSFATKKSAAHAYNISAYARWGEFSRLNTSDSF